jgi:Lar family restriction alleviation protein
MIDKCPFCGNTDQDEFAIHKEWRQLPTIPAFWNYNVICSCGAMGPDADTKEEAEVLWNKRSF